MVGSNPGAPLVVAMLRFAASLMCVAVLVLAIVNPGMMSGRGWFFVAAAAAASLTLAAVVGAYLNTVRTRRGNRGAHG